MLIIYIFGGLVAIVFLIEYLQTKSKNNSPYFKIKKKLEEDLIQASFSGDWKKKQDLNLQLLWLKIIKNDVEVSNISGKNNIPERIYQITKLTENEIMFQSNWQLDNFYHFPLSQEIIAGYRKTLVDNDYKVYKPESILPYPKDIIKKAILFTFDYLNHDKPLYTITNKKELADNLNAIRAILLENFVNTSKSILPKDAIENYRIGKQLRDEQLYKEEDDLHLIDWRTASDWMIKGVHYAESKQYEYAFICFEKSEELNPDNNDLKIIKGITYYWVGEEYLEKGEKALAFDYITKSAKFQNEDAIKWLNEYKK